MTLKRILSVMLVSVLVFVCVPFSVGAAVNSYPVNSEGRYEIPIISSGSLVMVDEIDLVCGSASFTVPETNTGNFSLNFRVSCSRDSCPYPNFVLRRMDTNEILWDRSKEDRFTRIKKDFYSGGYIWDFTFLPGIEYRIENFSFHADYSGITRFRVWFYLRSSDRLNSYDTTHKEIPIVGGGGDSRGGGAGRRWDYSKVTVKNGELEDPITGDSALRQDLQILNEADKKVNLVTPEGAKEYSYTNYTYNTETNTTTVYTTTNEIINITSTEEKVNVEYTDNSGQTTIYNYYYITEGGGSSSEPGTPGESSSEPDTPGGISSEPDTPGGSSSEPDTPGGSSSEPDTPPGEGGFSWDWLWSILKTVGSFILGLIETLGTLIGDALKSLLGIFDFITGFTEFLGASLSFIPSEIWLLIAAGIAVSIILRIFGR